jgi:acyl dehydratase
MLCNWIGDHGFLHKLDVTVRAPNLVGNTIWWHAAVEAKREIGAVKLVDLKVKAINQKEEHSASGTATVALPSRADGPVPLPLSPAMLGIG